MTGLGFNLGGYVYQSGISTLRKSYDAAEMALSVQIDNAASEVAQYEAWLESEGEATMSRDEDGFAADDNLPNLTHEHNNTIEALDLLRKAFAVTIYHYWERWSQKWFGRAGNHEALVKRMRTQATYPIHPGMDNFYCLINILKHNKEKYAPALLHERSDFFLSWFDGVDDPDWEQGIRLKSEHITEFLEIIASSGPTEETKRNRRLKIVTWNCNGAFRKKYSAISELDADIYVIQECEDPAKSDIDYIEWAGKYVWSGNNANKGIGVFVKNGLSVSCLDWADNGLQQFLPVRINDIINLVAVWTKDDRIDRMGYIGQFWQYLQHHSPLLSDDTIICGDFNSNAIWDKLGRYWNHSECVSKLSDMGFNSLYHDSTGEQQGKEKQPTLYHQRNINKPYHVDYIFTNITNHSIERSLIVGHRNKWLSLSDHMPVSTFI